MQSLNSIWDRATWDETKLVVQCARTFLSWKESACLEAALMRPVDWAAVERTADSQAMMPLVAYVLKCAGILIPQEVCERIHQRLLLAAQTNLTWLGEWQRILLAFRAAGISVISLKGPGLALLAYGNITLREFSDLDLLIQPVDVLRARDVLVREGYRLRYPLRGDSKNALLSTRNRELAFVRDRPGTLIELHWGVLHEMFSFQLPVEELFKSARVEHQEGFSFLSPSREGLLLYLCAHGTKHCWSCFRWLCDVASYVKRTPELDWKTCMQSADDAGCDLVLKHGLLLAQQVLGLDLPEAVRSYCDSAEARALTDMAARFLFRGDTDVGYFEALQYQSAFAKDWRGRSRFVLERVFVPEEQDWQEMRLPDSLRFLYYAVRPLRFMRQRIAKA
jgi:hypothetical protein